jgi:hypothetical protein
VIPGAEVQATLVKTGHLIQWLRNAADHWHHNCFRADSRVAGHAHSFQRRG